MAVSAMKVYGGEKGACLVPRGGTMQLTGLAENKSQVLTHTVDACAKSAKLPGEAWE